MCVFLYVFVYTVYIIYTVYAVILNILKNKLQRLICTFDVLLNCCFVLGFAFFPPVSQETENKSGVNTIKRVVIRKMKYGVI